MDRLCDDIIQLIYFELNDPTNLILCSKRYYKLSQDPYVRARYFLARYGNVKAMFMALGRGKLMTVQVIDILLSSGAHLSRYLIQLAIQHRFRSPVHFIKTQWVKRVPFNVFTHLLSVAAQQFGDIPHIKGGDDGSIFNSFVKDTRTAHERESSWPEIKEIMEKYKFIPFSVKDPAMAQFPGALAIEPQLLPLAVANGFQMDHKYRDFVFRKMFERVNGEFRTDEIVANVRSLSKLDPTMFLSKTVAGEICMEAKVNGSAYAALKQLDHSHDLLFDLASLVEELIKLFIRSRSIILASTIQALRQLYTDFPSSDSTVRAVMLLTVFVPSPENANQSSMGTIETLRLNPLTRKDILNLLVNPFVENVSPVLECARNELNMTEKDIQGLVEEVALRCLEIGSKGNTLRNLVRKFSHLTDFIASSIRWHYQIELENLPSSENEAAQIAYRAPLSREYAIPSINLPEDQIDTTANLPMRDEDDDMATDTEEDELDDEASTGSDPLSGTNGNSNTAAVPDLGTLSQETLTHMIRQDDMMPYRSRRRYHWGFPGESGCKHTYPSDNTAVAFWVLEAFGTHHLVTSMFMTHALINNNTPVMNRYLGNINSQVPVTLEHFKLLARLGRAPHPHVWQYIRNGEFYFSEEDYVSKQPAGGESNKTTIKTERSVGLFELPNSSFIEFGTPSKPKAFGYGDSVVASSSTTVSSTSASSLSACSSALASASSSSSRGRKRPRRAATRTVKSYVEPEEDDEDIADMDSWYEKQKPSLPVKKKTESNLQLWIRHLGSLLKEEQKKHSEKKRRLEQETVDVRSKLRVPRGEFFKSLASHLRELRKLDMDKRQQLYGTDAEEHDYSEGELDEFKPPSHRRKLSSRT